YRIVAVGQASGQTAAKTFRVTRPQAAPASSPTDVPTATPTAEPAPQEVVFLPVADSSVSAPPADGTPTAEQAGGRGAGGAGGAVAYVTCRVEGITAGSVVSAQLVLTNVGDAGAAAGTIGALGDVRADPGWTYDTAPRADVPPAIAADGSA